MEYAAHILQSYTAGDVASPIRPILNPGCIDAEYRRIDDETGANGLDDDEEWERGFLEWMNEPENTDMGQHNRTQLQDQEHQYDVQDNSHQESLSPDTCRNDDVHPKQAPDISPPGLPPTSESIPATEDQRIHDALHSPGLMQWREALEANYNLNDISHASYAIAVYVHCTALNPSPAWRGR